MPRGGIFPLRPAGERLRGIFSFLGKRISPFDPQEKGITLAACGSKGCSACRLHCLRGGIATLAAISSAIRLASASIIRCRSAHLLLVRCNRLLTTVQISRRAPAMPPWQAKARLIKSKVERSCVRLTTRRQSDSEDRSKSSRLDTTLGRHPIRQAPQLFALQTSNGGVKGRSPLRSLGGVRGPFSHVREWPPYLHPRVRRGVYQTSLLK